MALSTNKEIIYESGIERIEHLTGKIVLSWRQDPHRLGVTIFFTDKTMCHINEMIPVDWTSIEYLRIPTSICVSCGQDAHVSSWNWKGQCSSTTKKFWQNVRKMFWHRHAKSK